jgi:tRNA (guanine10-N2)-dimethyltransferase
MLNFDKQDSQHLFFIVSGEHESLPSAEVKAILESSGRFDFVDYEKHYRLLNVHGPSSVLRDVAERSLMYDRCGLELGRCRASEDELFRLIRSLPLDKIVGNAKSFAARSIRLHGVNKTIRRPELERGVGALIKERVPRLSVQLHASDLTFLCIMFDDSFLFGIVAYTKPSGLIAPRRPRKRPVFHPATMPPKIARCMVNLARAKPRGTFADPFSGVGGIAIEAAVIGCDVVAVDASLRMVRGARRNLRHFALNSLGFVLGDARSVPLQGLQAIATDPPYGRDSSTRGVKVENLYSEFLAGTQASLRKGAHVCISAPSEIDVESFATDSGLKVREKYLVRIHRSLTRQFVVIQNQ